MNRLGDIRPSIPPPRLATPRSDAAAPPGDLDDRVTLSWAGAAQPYRMPGPILTAGAAATPGPTGVAAAQGLRILSDLQAKGFHALYRRRFWIPLLMKRRLELTPQQFLERLDQGSRRLEIGSDAYLPAAVRNRADLDALDAIYLNGPVPPHDPLAGTLHALLAHGDRFYRGDDEIGAYGTWRDVQDGRTAKHADTVYVKGSTSRSVATAEDASRLRYFYVDGVADGLSHPAEAATLKGLEAKKAEFWTGDDNARGGAEDVYRRLFQAQPATVLRIGTRESSLIEVAAARLGDARATQAEFDAAVQRFEQLKNTGVGGSARDAWPLVEKPVGAESFTDRLAWLSTLVAADPAQPQAAVNGFRFLAANLRGGDTMNAAIQEWLPIRGCFGRWDDEPAQKAFLAIRDHLDDTFLGAEPATARHALALQLLKAHADVEAAATAWKAMSGTAPRSERVAAWLGLHALENNNFTQTQADYEAVVAAQRSGESLHDATAAFTQVRPLLGRWDGAGAVEAFRFIRLKLDASLPGPWSSAEREKMFLALLGRLQNTGTAVDSWRFLTGETDKTPPHPPADFPQRLASYAKLLGAVRSHSAALPLWQRFCGVSKTHPQPAPPADFPDVIDGFVEIMPVCGGTADQAATALEAVHATAGGTLAERVADYKTLRALVGRWDAEGALALYKFVHEDLQAAQRPLFLKIQAHNPDVASSREAWTELSASPTDLAERVDALAKLLETEPSNMAQARLELACVLAHRAGGEPIAQVTDAYADVRKRLGRRQGASQGVDTFSYLREKVAPAQAGEFLDMVGVAQDGALSREIWEAVKAAGSDAGFRHRIAAWKAQPASHWRGMLETWKQVETTLPQGVDRDRGCVAMLGVADRDGALERIAKQLDHEPGADRMASLEWLCSLMAEAGSAERFDEAIHAIDLTGGPASPVEQRAVLQGLLHGAHGTRDGFAASLAVLQRLEALPADRWADTSQQAVAFMSAMRGHATDAATALQGILDVQASGAYGKATLETLLARFAEVYTVGGSVDKALARMAEETRQADHTIQDNDDGLVIGGIRVPRKDGKE